MTAFDVSERRIWEGRAESYARTFARLCAHTVPDGRRRHAAAAAPHVEHPRARPGVDVRCGSLPQLPYEDDEFDAVVANFVLNHVGRPLDALAEMHRITRPGGRVAVTIWQAPGAPGQALIGRAAEAAGLTRPRWLATVDPEHNFPRTREGLCTLLEVAGLDSVRSEALAWDHRVGAEDWWAGPAAGVAAIGQLVNSRGPAGVAAAKREYDALCTEFAADDGRLALPHVALLARGSRPGG